MSAPTAATAAPAPDKPPRPRRWVPLSLRLFVVINGAIALIGIASFWFIVVRPVQRHAQAYHRISNAVQSLVHRRPADVSRKEWSYVIGWTMNAIGNCCSVEQYLNPDEESHERFRTLPDRFEQRLRADVSFETIDWLWDELEIISKYGKRYSESWRPTTPDHLAEADRVTIGPEVP